jgi:hypothetical protein
MLLTSDMPYAPYLDIFTTGPTPWAGVTPTTRLGNLAGIYDGDFGGALSGEGLYSENVYLKGSMKIGSGEGITLIGDDLSPGVIRYSGSSHTVTSALRDTEGYSFSLAEPSADDAVLCSLGSEDKRFYWMGIYADIFNVEADSILLGGVSTVQANSPIFSAQVTDYAEITNYNQADRYSLLHMTRNEVTEDELMYLTARYGSGYAQIILMANDGGGLIQTRGVLAPYASNTDDIGSSGGYYRYIYASRHYYKTAPASFDIIDDLAAIKGIRQKTLHDGRIALDPVSGVPLIEPMTLPDTVLARYDEDLPAETYRAEDGSIIQIRSGHSKGELVTGPDGEPFIDMGSLVSFVLGSARNLALLAEGLDARIGALEDASSRARP